MLESFDFGEKDDMMGEGLIFLRSRGVRDLWGGLNHSSIKFAHISQKRLKLIH